MEGKGKSSLTKISFKIRDMAIGDIPRIMSIEELSFSSPWSEDSFRSFMGDVLSFSLVLQCENEIAGYAMGWIVEEYAELANIAVDSKFRRMGLGKELVEKVVGICREKSVEGIFLEVRESNLDAIALYSKYGFEEIGYRKEYYRNPREDALVLMLKL